MTDFNKNPRRKQELKARPIMDDFYQDYFNPIEIVRYKHLQEGYESDSFILDKHFAIDVIIKFASGMQLTCQEKCLSYDKATYNSITIEYMNDPIKNEFGDWFKISCDIYFMAYFNKDNSGFCKWAIVDLARLKILTNQNKVEWQQRCNTDGHAKANFKYCNVKDLDRSCIIDQKGFY